MRAAAFLAIASAAIPAAAFGQIPPSEALSATDSRLFHQELQRVEGQLETAGDKCTVMYALARTWASGGQYREALETLKKVAALRVGLDPSRDEFFAKLRGTNEFEQLLKQIREDNPPVFTSHLAFTIPEADLFPEGIAYDPVRNQFFLGSTFKHKIIRCTRAGVCRPLVKDAQDGLDQVLGLKVDPKDGTVWAASNRDAESGLFHYTVPSGNLMGKYTLSRRSGRHLFNDLAINSSGDVFVTDTQAGTVYWVSRATDHLEVFDPRLKVTAANGIAISSDGRKLYVAGFPDGITVVDLAARSFRAMEHPAGLCLATIDGLAFSNGDLIAIQNGIMANRVVRYRLSRNLNAIEGFDVLERGNPLFDGITTGAAGNGKFYFMANTQLDKVVDGKITPGVKLNPIKILETPLPTARR